MKRKVDEQNSI